jgi:hypothetical protein
MAYRCTCKLCFWILNVLSTGSLIYLCAWNILWPGNLSGILNGANIHHYLEYTHCKLLCKLCSSEDGKWFVLWHFCMYWPFCPKMTFNLILIFLIHTNIINSFLKLICSSIVESVWKADSQHKVGIGVIYEWLMEMSRTEIGNTVL